ncbi:MAG: heparan-alpha-glucosaminide N-acetyltransferase [Burkholderiaceae bacterium]
MNLSARTARYDRIDLLRAAAMLWMTAYHFCFDLNHFGFIDQNFYRDPLWTWQRTAIVSLFLFTAGLSQAVAHVQAQTWARFWRRWGRIVAAALLVTAGSMVMFPRSFIYFGVLHGIAAMVLIVRLTAGWRGWLWPAGALALLAWYLAPVAIGAWPAAEVLNAPALNWLGLISRKPVTEDYVPLLPWLAVMWWGVATGQWMLQQRPDWLRGGPPALSGPRRWLVVMGRWSLSYYLLHQPVMIGLLMAFVWLRGSV